MADISKGFTFTSSPPGNAGTPANFNALVDSATILPAFVSAKPATAPALGDTLLAYDLSGGALIAPTITQVLALQAVDAAVNVGSLRTIGTGAQQAAPGTVDATALTGSVRTLGYSGNSAAPGATTPSTSADNTFTGRQTIAHIGGDFAFSPMAIAANANLGSTGTATLDSKANDLAGLITLTPGGTGITTGTQASLTFSGTPAFLTVAPYIILVPRNGNAQTAQNGTKALLVANPTTTGCDLTVAAALTTGVVYIWSYIIIAG